MAPVVIDADRTGCLLSRRRYTVVVREVQRSRASSSISPDEPTASGQQINIAYLVIAKPRHTIAIMGTQRGANNCGGYENGY